ncbi:MAG: RNA polymerase sigma-70 factor [Bacteroidia bacterium]|nr:RNA polymerase sigma-70 factor [Bacteroidia bacterium]
MKAYPISQPVALKNEKEFRGIFDHYYVTLCLFANQYVENEALAADIVQECFVKLWQLRQDFFYLHQIKSFLYTAVRNKALNELDHQKVKTDYLQKATDKTTDSFYTDHLIEEESYRLLIQAIDELPKQMRSIMLLALEGLSNKEIAEKLAVSTETIHTLKKTAYKKLRENLKGYYYLLFLLFMH